MNVFPSLKFSSSLNFSNIFSILFIFPLHKISYEVQKTIAVQYNGKLNCSQRNVKYNRRLINCIITLYINGQKSSFISSSHYKDTRIRFVSFGTRLLFLLKCAINQHQTQTEVGEDCFWTQSRLPPCLHALEINYHCGDSHGCFTSVLQRAWRRNRPWWLCNASNAGLGESFRNKSGHFIQRFIMHCG